MKSSSGLARRITRPNKFNDPPCAWVECSGEAHQPDVGGMIDHCMICAPHWGRVAVCRDCGGKIDQFTADGETYRVRPKCRNCGKPHHVDANSPEAVTESDAIHMGESALAQLRDQIPRASADDEHVMSAAHEALTALLRHLRSRRENSEAEGDA